MSSFLSYNIRDPHAPAGVHTAFLYVRIPHLVSKVTAPTKRKKIDRFLFIVIFVTGLPYLQMSYAQSDQLKQGGDTFHCQPCNACCGFKIS